jgi:hypothetical protein
VRNNWINAWGSLLADILAVPSVFVFVFVLTFLALGAGRSSTGSDGRFCVGAGDSKDTGPKGRFMGG